jgi:integrase
MGSRSFHTARRTGATLTYLARMDYYDIMRVTGHTSPAMLKKYIKADSIEVAAKITDKYSYFD